LEARRLFVNVLVETIRSCIKPHPKPCVNISGGIDSTIVLHHLSEKCKEPIHTYTAAFTEQETELAHARQVSDHYGTIHKEVIIDDMLKHYPEILKLMDRPRFNLWPFWLAQQQYRDQRLNCYIGEGGDEHFGGYWYKPQCSYPEQWAHLFNYVDPTYRQIYEHFGIKLHAPLHPRNLRFTVTYPYYDHDQEKKHLRKAYADVLPSFVLERRKLNGRKDYWAIWQKELSSYFPKEHPRSEEDIIRLWNYWVTCTWVGVHSAAEHQRLLEVLV